MILQLADTEQRGDDAQQLVDIGQRRLGGRGKGVAVAIVAHPPLDPCAQACQRRAELVRDIVADPAHVADQQLEPVEHQVDVGAEQPETVGIARHRQPPGQVAAQDPLGQAADRIDLPRRPPPGDQPEDQRDQDARHQPDQQRLADQPHRCDGVVQIDADQQARPVRHRTELHPRLVATLARQFGGHDGGDERPAARRPRRQVRDIARDPPSAGIEQRQKEVAMDVAVQLLAQFLGPLPGRGQAEEGAVVA